MLLLAVTGVPDPHTTTAHHRLHLGAPRCQHERVQAHASRLLDRSALRELCLHLRHTALYFSVPGACDDALGWTQHLIRRKSDLRRVWSRHAVGQTARRCGSKTSCEICMKGAALECRYTPAWQGHVLAHLPFYFCLFPMYLDLVIHTASVAAQQAAKHLRRVVRVRYLYPCAPLDQPLDPPGPMVSDVFLMSQDAGQRHSAQQSSVSAGMELHRPEFLQAFYRETELCKLLREVEVAHACLHAGRAIPDSAQVDLDLTLLATLTTQQFGLLERAATASRDGRKQAEDAVDFQIFAVDVPPCAPLLLSINVLVANYIYYSLAHMRSCYRQFRRQYVVLCPAQWHTLVPQTNTALCQWILSRSSVETHAAVMRRLC